MTRVTSFDKRPTVLNKTSISLSSRKLKPLKAATLQKLRVVQQPIQVARNGLKECLTIGDSLHSPEISFSPWKAVCPEYLWQSFDRYTGTIQRVGDQAVFDRKIMRTEVNVLNVSQGISL